MLKHRSKIPNCIFEAPIQAAGKSLGKMAGRLIAATALQNSASLLTADERLLAETVIEIYTVQEKYSPSSLDYDHNITFNTIMLIYQSRSAILYRTI